MQVIPVLDLLHGSVVRGIAGRREAYAPIRSLLTDSTDPLEVSRAYRRRFEVDRLYVADLDAIMNDDPQWSILEELAGDGVDLVVDAGLRDVGRARRLVSCGVSQVVAALETLPGPHVLRELIEQIGCQRVAFSLDLKNGRTLGDLSGWGTIDPEAIAGRAIEEGAASLIVLDLASVGTGGGVPTRGLCRRIRDRHPHVTLISGGGIRDGNDLIEMRLAGVDGVLVASALHDGRITRDDISAVHPAIQADGPTAG